MIDSSSSSAESSFRELDEVFLQTQTRIWLGEVLNTRLDEDLHLFDLLQDGDILFEVSKVVWNLLLTKCMELRHLKHKYGQFGSRRSSGRYRPYSNVDSFIKICKILGLSGIDLFSPSDVVEKRDIRKVCICIRALSKKARSKQLSVPDFDMVIYSVAMPKNMVGVIRKSLESSQCTLSSSSSYSSRKVSQMKLQQKNLYAPSNGDDDYSSSEESDEAESRYMGENSFSSAGKFDFGDGINSDLENSPEGQCIAEFKYEHGKSASLSETIQSFSQQHLENDQELDKMSSCGGISHVNNDASQNPGNGAADIANISFTPENDYSVVGDSSCINDGESNYISDYLAFSDLMVHATDGSNSVIHDGENNMFDFFLNIDSHGPTSSRRSFQNGPHRKFSDDEDMEVSSTTSMTSVLGRLLNLEFGDQFDVDDSLSANDHSSVSKEHEAEKQCKGSLALSEPPKVDTYETNYRTVLFDSREAQSEMTDKCELFSGMEPLEGELCGVKPGNPEKRDMVVADNNQDILLFREDVDNVASDCLKFPCNSKSVESERSSKQCQNINVQGFSVQDAPPVVPSSATSDNHPSLPTKDMNRAKKGTPVAYNIQDNISSAAENGSQGESISEGRMDASHRLPAGKHGRRPLLRTVVKGTAIAGVLFLLLHIGRKSKGNNAQETLQYGQVLKYSNSKSSSTKGQKGSVGKGIYPAGKLKL